MNLLWYFLGGLFAFNSIPHLVKGITGESHMTPFKKVSSPILNIVWAFINIIISGWILGAASGNGFLLPWTAAVSGSDLMAFLLGGLVISLADANLFGNPNSRLPWQKD